MYTSHFIGFLLSCSFVLITRTKVGTCNTKNEKPNPLTDNSEVPDKVRTIDKISQIPLKNEPYPIKDLKTIWLSGNIIFRTYNAIMGKKLLRNENGQTFYPCLLYCYVDELRDPIIANQNKPIPTSTTPKAERST